MRKRSSLLVLLLIVVLAFFLRFYKLGSLLPLFGDEVDTGYNAYSLLKTGKDITGHFLPVYLTTLIDVKSSLLAYLSTIPIHFLGLNEVSIRLIPSLAGTFSVLFIYLIAKEIFDSKNIGLLSAGLAAITPWLIHFSRGAFEANLMLFLLLVAVFFFLKSPKKELYLYLSALFFDLSLYSYHAAKILVPGMIFCLILSAEKKFLMSLRIKRIYFFLILVVLSLPIIYSSIFSGGQTRFSQVSLFSDQKLIDEIILKRALDPISSTSSRIFHNKVEHLGQKILNNYLESFSPQFLFLYGDPNFRHSSGFGGEFLYLTLPFFLIGLYYLFKEKQKKRGYFLFSWLLVSPLPAVLTQEGNQHAIRLIFMAPVLIIISAYGMNKLLVLINDILGAKKACLFAGTIFLVLAVNFIFYLHQYFVHYPNESWRYWAYGYKELMRVLKDNQGKYEKVFINNSYEPSILWFLFWTGYEPKIFSKEEVAIFETQRAIAYNLGKYYFYRPSDKEWKYNGIQEILRTDKNFLVVASTKEDTAGDKDLRRYPPKGVRVINTITDPFGKPIFYFLEKNN